MFAFTLISKLWFKLLSLKKKRAPYTNMIGITDNQPDTRFSRLIIKPHPAEQADAANNMNIRVNLAKFPSLKIYRDLLNISVMRLERRNG